jgi:hypothetical protein
MLHLTVEHLFFKTYNHTQKQNNTSLKEVKLQISIT